MKWLVVLLATALANPCLSATTSPGAQTRAATFVELPDDVLGVLRKYKLPASSLSVFVQEIGERKPLLQYEAGVPRNPASVMKVVTTAVALHELGPGYRWETRAYASAPVVGGKLEGDLILKGFGDPFLVTESFWLFLRKLRERGLTHITGDLVLDESFFDLPKTDPGAFDGKPHRAYNQPPSALLVNFQATNFNFRPDQANRKVLVFADPPSTTIKVDNRVKLTKGQCRGMTSRLRMGVTRAEGYDLVRFDGTYPEACGTHTLLRSVSRTQIYIYGLFKQLWSELGGTIDGRVRTGVALEDANLLYSKQSRSVSELIRAMNKFSNNVMTRNLLLTLGAERYGPPGTVDKGRKAIYHWLTLNGVKAPELFVENGSGLSRRSRVTAKNLGQLLMLIHTSPLMPEFVSSLPLSAIDGTLRRRFVNEPLAGRVHIKTGLIKHVRAMAGYLKSRSGRDFVVVSLQNYKDVDNGTGTEVQDALLRWLFEQ